MKYFFILLAPLPAISMQKPIHIFKHKQRLSNGEILISYSSDNGRASATKKEPFFENFEGVELDGIYEIVVVSQRDLFLSLRYQYKEQKKLRRQTKNKLQ